MCEKGNIEIAPLLDALLGILPKKEYSEALKSITFSKGFLSDL